MSADDAGAEVEGVSDGVGGAEVLGAGTLVVGAAVESGAEVLGAAACSVVRCIRGTTTGRRECVAEADARADVAGSSAAGWVAT